MGFFKQLKESFEIARDQVKQNMEEAQKRLKEQQKLIEQTVTDLGKQTRILGDKDDVLSSRLELLIKSALQDGVLTEQERAVILRRAEKEGEDPDEVEMIINARLAEIQQENGIATPLIEQKTKPEEEEKPTELEEEELPGEEEAEELEMEKEEEGVGDAEEESSSQVVFQPDNTLREKESIVIPEGITEIEELAFDNFRLKSVTLPSTLVKIGKGAFKYCKNLTFVDFSRCKKLVEIGEEAFGGHDDECAKFKQIDLPDSIRHIGKDAFRDIEKIVFPASLEEIVDWAFGDPHVDNLRVADFSKCKKLERIGKYAFRDVKTLETVILPPNLKNIGDSAFSGCSALTSITIPNSVKEIGNSAFSRCSIRSVILPSSLKRIGGWAFSSCKNLEEIDFSKCDKLEEIGEYTFNSTGLTEIVIPDSVEHIGKSAFADNEKLERATIGSSAKDYISADYDGISRGPILKNTPNLKELTFRSEVAEYTGAITLTKVIFCDTVKELGKWAVAECSDLEVVVLPDSVTKIGYGAFVKCSNLSSVILSDNITEIGEGAFARTKLKEIVFPRELQKLEPLGDELTKLRKLDFSKVTKLKVLPEHFIGYDIPKLREIVIPIGVERIEEYIGGVNLDKIFLPPTIKEVEDLYQENVDIYCFSPAIEELEQMVESIEDEENAIRLHVLPKYVESYKAQRDAEGISEKILIIDTIPEELQYFYDN